MLFIFLAYFLLPVELNSFPIVRQKKAVQSKDIWTWNPNDGGTHNKCNGMNGKFATQPKPNSQRAVCCKTVNPMQMCVGLCVVDPCEFCTQSAKSKCIRNFPADTSATVRTHFFFSKIHCHFATVNAVHAAAASSDKNLYGIHEEKLQLNFLWLWNIWPLFSGGLFCVKIFTNGIRLFEWRVFMYVLHALACFFGDCLNFNFVQHLLYAAFSVNSCLMERK